METKCSSFPITEKGLAKFLLAEFETINLINMNSKEILKRIGYDNNSITETEKWIANMVYQLAMNDAAASKNLVLADVRHQLIAYQKWCYEHPEYDQVTETSKVELYLKAINCA